MIVITAPTGNIGHQVLSHLLEAGAPARALHTIETNEMAGGEMVTNVYV